VTEFDYAALISLVLVTGSCACCDHDAPVIGFYGTPSSFYACGLQVMVTELTTGAVPSWAGTSTLILIEASLSLPDAQVKQIVKESPPPCLLFSSINFIPHALLSKWTPLRPQFPATSLSNVGGWSGNRNSKIRAP